MLCLILGDYIEDIEVKWRDRGVSAIAYDTRDALWDTLAAWADRSDDPRAWRTRVVDLACKGPRHLASLGMYLHPPLALSSRHKNASRLNSDLAS